MCLAFPGKIISLDDNQHAVVDFDGVQKNVNISLVKGRVGEYVIVHAGFAVEKMSDDDAWEVLKIYEEQREKDNRENK